MIDSNGYLYILVSTKLFITRSLITNCS